MKLIIDEMFAFVADGDEGEGIMGIRMGDTWMPLVGADMNRVTSLIPYADHIKKETGIDYRILKFSHKEDITSQFKG